MKDETLYKTKHKFIDFMFSEEGGAWFLYCENSFNIRLECFWRLLHKGRVKWTSNDHHQKFGHANHVDLIEEVKSLLNKTDLKEVRRNTLTGDLYLNFDNDYLLEAFTDSSGYESWEMNIGEKTYVGLGRGEISRPE